MSYQLFKADVLFFQRLLKSNGFYTDSLDGIWGPNTEAASIAFDAEYESIKSREGVFDRRTEEKIASLSIPAQVEARRFMSRALSKGVNVKIISGTRTYEEQNSLYRQGRWGNPGPRVTNAKGGQSNHNFGIAWDIGIFRADGTYSTNDNDYRKLADYATGALEWGGNWHTFPDPPHYQVKTIESGTSWVRARFESGETYVA